MHNIMYLLRLEEYYIHNIFTKFLNNKVIINFNLDIVLKLFFWSLSFERFRISFENINMCQMSYKLYI